MIKTFISIDPNTTPPAPGKPFKVTVTIEVVTTLDPADSDHSQRTPNQMMAALEDTLAKSLTARTIMVCNPDNTLKIGIDMSPKQSKEVYCGT